MEIPLNQIITGHCLEVVADLPDESIDLVVTSPPYFQVRSYGTPPAVWGGDPACDHEWLSPNIVRIQNSNGQGKSTLGHGTDGSYRIRDGPKLAELTQDLAQPSKKGGSFCARCDAWKGEIGREPTVDLYVEHLCLVFDRIWRVLTPWGTVWVNLGSKSSSMHTGGHKSKKAAVGANRPEAQEIKQSFDVSIKPGNDLFIPARFAMAMQRRGWVIPLGLNCVWHKLAAMPQSHKGQMTPDRESLLGFHKGNSKPVYYTNFHYKQVQATRPCEGIEGKDWEWAERKNWKTKEVTRFQRTLWKGHKYFFRMPYEKKKVEARNVSFGGSGAKQLQYQKQNGTYSGNHYDSEQCSRGRHKRTTWLPKTRDLLARTMGVLDVTLGDNPEKDEILADFRANLATTPLRKIKSTIWQVSTSQLKEAHYAPFSKKLVKPMIRMSCPQWVCTKCGLPVSFDEEVIERKATRTGANAKRNHDRGDKGRPDRVVPTKTIRVRCQCDCGGEFRRGRVLDPFGGSGTTGRAAQEMGRDWLCIEIKPEYVEIAQRLTPVTLRRWLPR